MFAGGEEVVLAGPAEARGFLAAGAIIRRSALRDEFVAAVAAAEATQAEAERLCDEANESGLENAEFQWREDADDLRFEALNLAKRLLGVP